MPGFARTSTDAESDVLTLRYSCCCRCGQLNHLLPGGEVGGKSTGLHVRSAGATPTPGKHLPQQPESLILLRKPTALSSGGENSELS